MTRLPYRLAQATLEPCALLTESLCLISTDDETYTYNNRINRLSTVQEHMMIKRAINRGVSPEKLAKSLHLDIAHIMKKVKLLDGICAEAAELLRDQMFSAKLSDVLRKMKPTRQVECVELMISANNITIPYAEALLAASPSHLLIGEVIFGLKGGYIGNGRLCVMVHAPGRPYLFIDPSGGDYARYVARLG